MSRLQLSRKAFPTPPARDTAICAAVLRRVAAGELPATLRVFRPGRVVAFGRRDANHPRFGEAVATAREQGFGAVVRLAGGRAAVFTEQTVALSLDIPVGDPHTGIASRFDDVAGRLVRALRDLGVDAAVGPVPGEYCPGRHSINAGGRVKLAGLGQRLVRGAAHTGGVLVVDAAGIAEVLDPVYRILDLDWDPASVGGVADEAPVDWETVRDALVRALARDHDLLAWEPDAPTLELAAQLLDEHTPTVPA